MLDSSPAVSLVLRKKYPKISRKAPKIRVMMSPVCNTARRSAAPITITTNRRVLLVLSL